MEVKAPQQILTQFRQMQENLQKQVETVHVEASAGGGMVTVKMNGQKQLTEIRIDPDIFAGKDQELLQDLVRAAVNEAGRRVDEELTSQMKNMTGSIPGMAGLKIPGFFLAKKDAFTFVIPIPPCGRGISPLKKLKKREIPRRLPSLCSGQALLGMTGLG